MVLRLYGTPYSFGATVVVAMVLLEKNIPFEFVAVDLRKGEHKTESFKANHPFGNVPYIDDEGFVLYESRAIARYLADKYPDQGTCLIPLAANVEEKAIFEQGASIELANFHPRIVKVVEEYLAKPMLGQPVDEVALKGYVGELSKVLDVYETILGKQEFMGGTEFSLVDIFHLAYAPGLASGGIDVMTSTGPNLARWWNNVISRPSWVKLKGEGIRSMI
ncbi:glutathione S-transferase [Roridomyces roridus]|uniref:glutathione transferase n=1 Tax=Roridomyces roridus TaxID=1738132 RepID=A0AAD7FKG0_9AGAR|nr:glutathione S-transferase [Roridomyces roridus]